MATLDLNLLRTFISIYETGSVTRAAAQLRITQPSVSHALARLRRHFDDPLFLRGRQGMSPTSLALELYDVFTQSLTRIDAVVESTGRFDPATSTRRFRLCLTDVGEMMLLPLILEQIARQAPQVELEVVPMDIDRVSEWLAVGSVDAAIASSPIEGSLHHTTVLTETYCALVRDDFPLEDGTITLEQFLGARHAIVSPGTGHWLAEQAIGRLGLDRKATVTLHHFSVLPNIIHVCGLVAIVPRAVAEAAAERWPLTPAALPFDVPAFPVRLHWQARDRESAAISWLHQTITAALRPESPATPRAAGRNDPSPRSARPATRPPQSFRAP